MFRAQEEKEACRHTWKESEGRLSLNDQHFLGIIASYVMLSILTQSQSLITFYHPKSPPQSAPRYPTQKGKKSAR